MGSIAITKIKRASDEAISIGVEISDGNNRQYQGFVMLDDYFSGLDLAIGEISRELMCDIEFWSGVTEAYFSACRSFAFAPCSLNALKRKLIVKGFDKGVAEQAIDRVKMIGFVDECDVARRRAEIFVGKLWGQTRILSKLREEGFGDEAADAVCDYLETVDMVELCTRLIEKRYGGVPEEREQRQRLSASLYRYGYSPSEIRRALSRLSE